MTQNPGDPEAPSYTDKDYYAFFFNGLAGIIDDAELSGYDEKGIEMLRDAQIIFKREFQTRHPDYWKR